MAVPTLADFDILASASEIAGGRILFEDENLPPHSEADLNRSVRSSRISFVPQGLYLVPYPLFTIGTQVLGTMRRHAAVACDRAIELSPAASAATSG